MTSKKMDLKAMVAGKVSGVAKVIELKSQGVSIEMVNPQILKDHPRNEHFFGKQSESKYQKLKSDIELMGILEPLICRRLDSGDLQILSGHTRRDAALELNLETVPVNVMTLDDIRAELVLHMTNTDNRDINDMVLARSMKAQKELIDQLRDKGEVAGKTSEILGEQYGMNPRKVERVMALNKLIPELQALVESGRMKSGIAEQWAKLEEEQQSAFYKTFQEEIAELTLAETQRLKKEADKLVDPYIKELNEAERAIEEERKAREEQERRIVELQMELQKAQNSKVPGDPEELHKLQEEIKRLQDSKDSASRLLAEEAMRSGREIKQLREQLKSIESKSSVAATVQVFAERVYEFSSYMDGAVDNMEFPIAPEMLVGNARNLGFELSNLITTLTEIKENLTGAPEEATP